MGINIYAIFILFQAFNQIIKPTVKYIITLHIPKLLLKNIMGINI